MEQSGIGTTGTQRSTPSRTRVPPSWSRVAAGRLGTRSLLTVLAALEYELAGLPEWVLEPDGEQGPPAAGAPAVERSAPRFGVRDAGLALGDGAPFRR